MDKHSYWKEVCGTCEWWDQATSTNVYSATAQKLDEDKGTTEKEKEKEDDKYGYCTNQISEFFKLFLHAAHFKCPEYERSVKGMFEKNKEEPLA